MLKDVTLEKAEAGKAYSSKMTQPRVEKGRMSPHDQDALLSRITATGDSVEVLRAATSSSKRCSRTAN